MKEKKIEKKWNLRETQFGMVSFPEISEISEKTGLSLLTSKLLYLRGYRTPEEANRFLRMEETSLHSPFLMKDMEKAARRLRCAIENKEKIAIYGDYDVDGVTSVSLLYLYLTEESANVIYDIPNRLKDGYGLSLQTVDRLKEQDAELIVTVDNGITSMKEVEYAKELGMEMIITDHHTCREDLPNAYAVVNPHREDDEYPFAELAGVGVVFKLVCAMEMLKCRLAGIPEINGVRNICRKYSDLAALGTISDVMPIANENRLIVAMGLKCMETNCRLGLKALMKAATNGKEIPRKMTSSYICFTIAPRMNAAGRVSSATLAVELLLAKDEKEAENLSEGLCRLNSVRKSEEERIFTEACNKIDEMPPEEKESVLVLDDDSWHQGVIGVVSSKLTEKYGLPSLLITYDGQMGEIPLGTDLGKGSGRSIEGLNLVNALSTAQDLLERFGGHALAAGFSLRRANVPEFRRRLNAYAKEFLKEEDKVLSIEADCEVQVDELDLSTAMEFGRLEPFGTGNPTPCFVLRDAVLTSVTPIGGGKHLRLRFKKDSMNFIATWFWNTEADLPISLDEKADLLFQMEINEYQNQSKLQLNLQDLQPAQSVKKRIFTEKQRYEEIKAGANFAEEENIFPERADFALVYQYLQKEYRLGRTSVSLRYLLEILSDSKGKRFHYAKLKYIFAVFQELSLCEINEPIPDHYLFEITFRANKTSLEKSSLLRRLRSQQKNDCAMQIAAGENL